MIIRTKDGWRRLDGATDLSTYRIYDWQFRTVKPAIGPDVVERKVPTALTEYLAKRVPPFLTQLAAKVGICWPSPCSKPECMTCYDHST
jgi:hypothetical protein